MIIDVILGVWLFVLTFFFVGFAMSVERRLDKYLLMIRASTAGKLLPPQEATAAPETEPHSFTGENMNRCNACKLPIQHPLHLQYGQPRQTDVRWINHGDAD